MTDNKRFTNHITKTDADGTIHSDGILDANENNKIIITNYFYIASLLNQFAEENEQLKEDAKQVLFVLACTDRDFKLSVNEAKAIKRLNECVDGCFDVEKLGDF